MRSNLQLGLASLIALSALISCGSERERGRETPNHESSNLARLDRELAGTYRTMRENHDSFAIEYADTFEMRMQEALSDRAAFDYPFDSLRANEIDIIDSDDRRVRIFNWMNPWSGTWRHFPAIVLARIAPDRHVVQNVEVFYDSEGEHPDIAYTHLHHVRDSLYLGLGVGQFSGMMPFEVAHGYVLCDTGFTADIPLFENSEEDALVPAMYIDKLWYRRNAEKFEHVMTYRSEAMELSYPELIDSASGEIVSNNIWGENSIKPTGKIIRLRFNGKYFAPVTGE